MLLFMLIISNF